ncbi:MAG: 4Fe-4S binding protein [bacterium]|nr:4Fe-4S binding protein [bacterium]
MNRRLRQAFQLIILLLVIWTIWTAGDVEKYCPMGGILGLGTKLHQGSLPCSMSSAAIFMAIALLFGALAIGKLFCGYICPVGSITEWFGKVGARFNLQFRLSKLWDRILRSLKYILLFLVVYQTITASELFCRKFDPYFGAATGFGHDTVLLWSILAVVGTLVGAIFIKQFWCRYFCFLGAASNMFVNIWGAVLVFGLYFVMNLLGAQLSILWLVAGLAFSGYLMEVGLFRSIPFPAFKITVDQNQCTQCGICSQSCPYDIPVQEFEKVTHPDCVMCTECISSCSEEKAVSINGSMKLKYLPAILLVALISLGFLLADRYEFSTLEKRWGKFEQMSSPAVYEHTNLKTVKCWGSANSLYNFLKERSGIYGLDAFAPSHRVIIYYDSTEISEEEVKKALFSPAVFRVRNILDTDPVRLAVWEVGIDNLFDSIDHNNLYLALSQNRFIYGVETYFGEPVTARIYFNSDSTSIAEIRREIETRRLEYEINGQLQVVELNFRCEGSGNMLTPISVAEFNRLMFEGFDLTFNDYDEFAASQLRIYEIGMPDAIDPAVADDLLYLVSGLSAEDGVVRFQTMLTDRPVARIYFAPTKTDSAKISQILFASTISYFIDENTTATIDNFFSFEKSIRILEVR